MFWVPFCLGSREYLATLDTGATTSLVAKKGLPCGVLKNIMPTVAIHMGDGHVVHRCGDCEVDVPMASRSNAHRNYVIDTKAFDFVSGTNFFAELPQIPFPTLQAPYALHVNNGDGGEFFRIDPSELTTRYLRLCKNEPSTMTVATKTEAYQVLGDALD